MMPATVATAAVKCANSRLSAVGQDRAPGGKVPLWYPKSLDKDR
jgi:hypothetical protein